MHGTFRTVDDQSVLRFQRELAHPVDAVWRALTQPEELEHWFPTMVDAKLRAGAQITFTFTGHKLPPMEGEVLEIDPPRRLVFSWGEDVLRFELEPDSEAHSVLTLEVVLGTAGKAARDAAGWHVCLDRLARRLDGAATEAPGTRPTNEWQEHYNHYVDSGLPATAPIPQ